MAGVWLLTLACRAWVAPSAVHHTPVADAGIADVGGPIALVTAHATGDALEIPAGWTALLVPRVDTPVVPVGAHNQCAGALAVYGGLEEALNATVADAVDAVLIRDLNFTRRALVVGAAPPMVLGANALVVSDTPFTATGGGGPYRYSQLERETGRGRLWLGVLWDYEGGSLELTWPATTPAHVHDFRPWADELRVQCAPLTRAAGPAYDPELNGLTVIIFVGFLVVVADIAVSFATRLHQFIVACRERRADASKTPLLSASPV
jgi:hypothetical protein